MPMCTYTYTHTHYAHLQSLCTPTHTWLFQYRLRYIFHVKKCFAAYEILGNPVKRRSYDSVDPEFDDTVPAVTQENKNNFFAVFRPVFEANARWDLKSVLFVTCSAKSCQLLMFVLPCVVSGTFFIFWHCLAPLTSDIFHLTKFLTWQIVKMWLMDSVEMFVFLCLNSDAHLMNCWYLLCLSCWSLPFELLFVLPTTTLWQLISAFWTVNIEVVLLTSSLLIKVLMFVLLTFALWTVDRCLTDTYIMNCWQLSHWHLSYELLTVVSLTPILRTVDSCLTNTYLMNCWQLFH